MSRKRPRRFWEKSGIFPIDIQEMPGKKYQGSLRNVLNPQQNIRILDQKAFNSCKKTGKCLESFLECPEKAPGQRAFLEMFQKFRATILAEFLKKEIP